MNGKLSVRTTANLVRLFTAAHGIAVAPRPMADGGEDVRANGCA